MIADRETVQDHLNPKTYKLIDLVTGEEIPVDVFVEKHKGNYWEKAYAKTLAEYIKCGTGRSIEVLAYLLEKKNGDNLIFGSQRSLAEKLKISTKIVSATITALKKKGLVKQVSPACLMLDPTCISSGNKIKGVILMRTWKEF